MSEKKHEEPAGESAPLWIISFCDLALCMLSFFVILSAGAAKDIKYDPEFAEIVAAIKKAFKNLPPARPSVGDPTLKDILGALKKNNKGKTGNSAKQGESAQRVDGTSGKHEMVTTIRPGTQTTIGGRVPFVPGSAALSEDGLAILRQIADNIRGHTNVFLVKGHTSRDEEVQLGDSGRDLSYERASAAVNKLVALGVAREGLRIQACRDFEPLREGAYNEVVRAENRRVEIVATEALVSEYHGQKDSNPRVNRLADVARRLDRKLQEQSANAAGTSSKKDVPEHAP